MDIAAIEGEGRSKYSLMYSGTPVMGKVQIGAGATGRDAGRIRRGILLDAARAADDASGRVRVRVPLLPYSSLAASLELTVNGKLVDADTGHQVFMRRIAVREALPMMNAVCVERA